MRLSIRSSLALVLVPLALGSGAAARADLAMYYVGRDTAAGTNQGRLTFLFNHGNHFHRLGPFGTEGRIPEPNPGGRIALLPGTGALAGRFVSGAYDDPSDPTSEFSDLEIRPISTLLGFPAGSPEATLIGGGQRYLGDLSGTTVALELVSISAGLGVRDGQGNAILTSPGSTFALGAGDAFAPFTPMFVTDLNAAGGSPYSATFRLVDLSGRVGSSGNFTYQLASVPEPGSLVLVGVGGGLLAVVSYRRRRRARAALATS
jgi:hypothetical protein